MFFVFILIIFLCLEYIKLGFFLFFWDFLRIKFSLFFNSYLFSFILIIVSLRVVIYRTYYLSGELNFNYFYFILLIFVFRMFSLIYSGGPFTLLLSWDLLGISSFFLVLFYNNWDRCRGAINTALTNRLGDFFIFLFFACCFFSGLYFNCFVFVCFFTTVMLLLTAFTKRAQFPFSSWLPKAIRAPTPISSLVHRRTLVTAGLVLLFNFTFVNLMKNFSFFMLTVGLFTMFFSSVAALLEEDIKKIVALSTLSQIGFSITTLGLGLNFISLIHLSRHALFKSCLFIQVGYIIHCSFGQQDGRGYNKNRTIPIFIQLQLLITLFCLCGLIFSRGSVRKDIVLELFYFNNYYLIFSVFFFFSVFLTFGYRYRLWKNFFYSFSKSVSYFDSSVSINFLRLVLVFFSLTFLWWLNSNLILIPSLFLWGDFFSPLLYITILLSGCFFSFYFILQEFTNKFLVDFFAKDSPNIIKNIKYSDLFLLCYNNSSFSFFLTLSVFFNTFFKRLRYVSLIVLLTFFLVFVWGLIL